MPPFSKEFAESARDIYRLAWTSDAYPGRLEPDGSIFAHPLYGIYVLNDYLAQYRREPSGELKKAIQTVAEAAVRRMSRFEGSLVFWYDPQHSFGRTLKRFYSGLTQSYYAVVFQEVGEILDDDRLLRAARGAFESLLVSAAKGGVLYKDEHGTSLAEVPQEPNSYILNGWLSALVSVAKYAKLSGSSAAKRLLDESAAAVLAVLPLYDVEELANSRYGLTGFMSLRVVSSDADAGVLAAKVTIPGQGRLPVPGPSAASRWQNHIVDDTTANIVVSRASHPEPNEVAMTLDAAAAGRVAVQVAVGTYHPRHSSPTAEEWRTIGEFMVDEGEQTLEVAIPWEAVDVAVYPTDFVKPVRGHPTNVYHNIHVEKLQTLAELTGNDGFAHWAERWRAYMCRWKDMPIYAGLWAYSRETGYAPVTDLCAG